MKAVAGPGKQGAAHVWRAAWDAVLGLGSNLGDKAANVEQAMAMLCDSGDVRVVSRSRLYRTAPWGVLDQDWFVNACIGVETGLPPRELLARCQEVETRMGRVRRRHWGERVIDVDILLYRDLVIAEPDLVVPHPRITERGFVLVPLADVAPDARVGACTVREWLAVTGSSDVVPLDSEGGA